MANEASPLGDLGLGDLAAAFSQPGGGAPAGGAAPMGDPAPAMGGGSGPAAGASAGAGAGPQVQSIDFILDIPLRLAVELGRTKMAVRDILQLAQGSVIELAKFAGEPLEVLVNDRLIARGEVVVVNEKFGIRLTDILSHVERIEQLK
ncbi:MAG: flagellar motor switch protein FliN [Bdellovibrionota bacterium]